MGRTRTRGVTLEDDGSRTVNKVWRGERIFVRLGKVSQEEAEDWLTSELGRRKTEQGRGNTRPLFADGARRYLIEAQQKASAETIAWHIDLLLPHIGTLPLDQIHDETLEPFVEDRLAGGMVVNGGKPLKPASPTTVNRSLEVVRTILNRSARAWRNKTTGKPLLSVAPPLITMLPESRRPPHPLSWEEQDTLFPKLANHLQVMALFDVNTGLRDENLCGLRWRWEVPVPEVGRSVFIVPAEEYKTRKPHVVILNDVAWSIIESQRKVKKTEYVFTYRDYTGEHRIDTMNNGGWQNARAKAKVPVTGHDLRHTFSSRLRLAGVSQEDRNSLMGHGGRSMPEHYASADVGRLIEIANMASNRSGTRTLLRVVNG